MLLGWSGKAAATWKYLVDKFPDNLHLLRQWGVSYLVVGHNDKARDVFIKVRTCLFVSVDFCQSTVMCYLSWCWAY